MITVLAACLAGGLGAMARAGVDEVVTRRTHAWRSTLLVNVLGSLVLGVASVTVPGAWLTVIGTGFCGGFTTFSTACWQAAREIGLRRWRVGVGYAVATIVGCLAAAWLGIQLGSW